MRTRLGRRVRHSLAKNADEALAFLTGQMPAFVTGVGDPTPQAIPVFVFHDVEPSRFARQLAFLRENEYRSVDSDELARGGAADRRVALTFDDATWTFWAYAYPLLRRYGHRAILFVVPGVVPESAKVRPNLDDVWRESCTRKDVKEAARRERFCRWPEILRMHDSGAVDVQSHSLTHARVPISPRIVDFLHPEFDAAVGHFEIPASTLDGAIPPERPIRLGAPVFESAPRLAGRHRFREDPSLVEESISFVEEGGGMEFFRRPGWRRILREEVVERWPPSERGRFESGEERDEAVRREFDESKRRIEERLPGKTVSHLAYPWHRGSALADRLAAETGYRSVLYGSHLQREGGNDGGILRIRRLPERYLMRLPGIGRASLMRALGTARRKESTP